MKHLIFRLFVLLPILTPLTSKAAFLLHGLDGKAQVQIEQGVVEGARAHGAWSFRGIPYAAPPVGDLRWKAPTAPKAWAGVFQAKNQGPICTQIKNIKYPHVSGSEDCLQLNVWSPKLDANLPVMVFIHGGGFINGSNEDQILGDELYDGTHMSKNGNVVVVTIKYRLGIFGFMAHSDLSLESKDGVSGNYGILDQIAALQWVQKNIHAFGGDPSRVTIFGESAGAASVLILMSSPRAKGLYSQAIVESGYFVQTTQSQAYDMGKKIADQFHCTDSTDAMTCLRALSSSALISGSSKTLDDTNNPFTPFPDGTIWPRPVLETFQNGLQNQVPFIMGSNSNEGSDLVKQFYPNPVHTDEELSTAVKQSLGEHFWNAVQGTYSSKTYGTSQQALIQLVTDLVFACPARQILNASPVNSAWRYVFSHSSSSIFIHQFGAGHAFELPYVFHFVPQIPILGFTPKEAELSESMESYWTRFATAGNPNPVQADSITPAWAAYDSTQQNYIDFNEQIQSSVQFRSNECDLLEQAQLN